MGKWIDADALKENMRGEFIDSVEERIAIREIDSAPSIDIVFCKECKYWNKSAMPALQSPNVHPCLRAFSIMLSRADDFCSRGERREP